MVRGYVIFAGSFLVSGGHRPSARHGATALFIEELLVLPSLHVAHDGDERQRRAEQQRARDERPVERQPGGDERRPPGEHQPAAARRRRIARHPHVIDDIGRGEQIDHRRKEDADDVLGRDRLAPLAQRRQIARRPVEPEEKRDRRGDEQQEQERLRHPLAARQHHPEPAVAPNAEIGRAGDAQRIQRNLRREQHVDQLRPRPRRNVLVHPLSMQPPPPVVE